MRAVLWVVVLGVALAAGLARAQEGDALQQLLDRLEPHQRAQVKEAVERLSPDQRELLLKRYEQLDPDQREFVERSATGKPAVDPLEARLKRQADNERRWAALGENERDRVRDRLRDFQALSEEEQEALVESHFARRTPDRRREMLNRLRDVPVLR